MKTMMYRTKWFMGFVAGTAVCIGGLQRLDAALTGQWDFNNTGNPLAQTVGQPLSYYDGAGGPTELGTRVGTTTLLGLPNIGGQPATVMLYPKCDANMGYYVVPGVPAAVAGGKAEVYTMVMDILFPTNGVWRGLLQIDDVDQVKAGMTRSQVRYLLGTPMVSDPFEPNRWDYVYTYQRGRDILQRLGDLGIQPVEAEGSEFDPRTCEAIGLMEVEDPGADGKVVETVRRGFLMQGEVLRAAQVRVGRYTDARSMSAPPDGQAALPDPLPEDARGPLVSGEDGNRPPSPERTEPGTAEATGEPERKGDPISPADVDF